MTRSTPSPVTRTASTPHLPQRPPANGRSNAAERAVSASRSRSQDLRQEVDSSWGGGWPLVAQGFRRLLDSFDEDPRSDCQAQAAGFEVVPEASLEALVEQLEPRLALDRAPRLEFLLYLPNLGRLRINAERRQGAGWWLALTCDSEHACRFLQRHADDCAARLSQGLDEPVALDVDLEPEL